MHTTTNNKSCLFFNLLFQTLNLRKKMISSNYKNNENEIEKENEIKKEDDVKRIEADVKWYHPGKGYGFLCYNDDFPNEIMIHFSKLEAIKCAYIKPGDRVICEVKEGKSGLQVERVIDVKFSSPEKRTLSGFIDSRLPPVDPECMKDVEGTIKWYNPGKGYGFILPHDKGIEIFLHKSILNAAGLNHLEPGTHVRAKIIISERGPEARKLIILNRDKTLQHAANF